MFASLIYRCEFSPLLPADYCQRELLFDVQRRRTEFVWKSDISFGDKALGPKAIVADALHYCQLGKLAVVTGYSRFHGNEGNRNGFIGSVMASRPLVQKIGWCSKDSV